MPDRYRRPVAAWLALPAWVQGCLIVIVTALGLAVCQYIFDRIVPTNDGWEIYWPYNGITVALMLLCRRKRWPWILAGFFLSFGLTEFARKEPFAEVGTDVLSNMAEIVLAAFFLPPFRSLEQWLREPRLLLRFACFAVLLGPALSSFPVGFYFGHRFPISAWSYASLWGLSDALGAALWIPLLLILFSRETYDLFRWRALPQTLLLLIGLCVISWVVFSQNLYPLGFLPYPILLLIAMRLGFSGAVIGANLLTVIAASRSLHHLGPFRAASGLWQTEHSVIVQIFCTLAVLFVFPLSVAKVERKNFEDRLRQAYADMKQLANLDALTGLANRRQFNEVLELEWDRAIRTARPVGLLMVDADCFKAYNDRYGHVAGDECLRRIADLLSAGPLRRHDLVARYGGEEFVVLLPGAAPSHLHMLAQQLCADVAAARIPHEGNPNQTVTISVGGASRIPTLAMSSQLLVDEADRALYAAKQNGRNRACFHHESPQPSSLLSASEA